jgi:hypothetical protein
VRGLDRRLVQVETLSQRRQQAAAPRYDVSDLTPREQYELALLLDRVGPAFSHQEWSRIPLTRSEQGRMEALVARMRVVEQGAR